MIGKLALVGLAVVGVAGAVWVYRQRTYSPSRELNRIAGEAITASNWDSAARANLAALRTMTDRPSPYTEMTAAEGIAHLLEGIGMRTIADDGDEVFRYGEIKGNRGQYADGD